MRFILTVRQIRPDFSVHFLHLAAQRFNFRSHLLSLLIKCQAFTPYPYFTGPIAENMRKREPEKRKVTGSPLL
jgi:hypothetical protein